MDIEAHVETSEQVLHVLETVAAYVLVGLFGIGVFDLGLSILQLARTGQITQTREVVDLIDKVLLLFIIVEIYQTVVAYAREDSVVRIVIVAGVIAVTRKVISYHPHEFADVRASFVAAASYALLLAVLVAALYVVRRTSSDVEW